MGRAKDVRTDFIGGLEGSGQQISSKSFTCSGRQGLLLIYKNSYSWLSLEFLASMMLKSKWLCFGIKSQSGLRLDPKPADDRTRSYAG